MTPIDEDKNKKYLEIFGKMNAIVKNSHLVYTSKKHGREYVNKDALYYDTELISQLCYEIALRFANDNVEVVIGPEKGGIILSQYVAHHLTELTGHKVISVFAEKETVKDEIDPKTGKEKEIFVIKRGYDKLIAGKRALVVEDILTTGGSVKLTLDAVGKYTDQIVGVGNLCNRGSVKPEDIGVTRLESLVNVDLIMYPPEECPLCKEKIPINTQLGHGKDFLKSPEGIAIYGNQPT